MSHWRRNVGARHRTGNSGEHHRSLQQGIVEQPTFARLTEATQRTSEAAMQQTTLAQDDVASRSNRPIFDVQGIKRQDRRVGRIQQWCAWKFTCAVHFNVQLKRTQQQLAWAASPGDEWIDE